MESALGKKPPTEQENKCHWTRNVEKFIACGIHRVISTNAHIVAPILQSLPASNNRDQSNTGIIVTDITIATDIKELAPIQNSENTHQPPRYNQLWQLVLTIYQDYKTERKKGIIAVLNKTLI